jgi:hypothetical protein
VVAHLGLVGHAAEGDDGPVLKLKRRNLSQLVLGPRQVADDKAWPMPPDTLPFPVVLR